MVSGASDNVGGIVGYIKYSTVTDSFNVGSVSAVFGDNVGGIAGYDESASAIASSIAFFLAVSV